MDDHIRTEPATPDRWPDVVAVMGNRGDPAHCWCQYFRLRGKDWDTSSARGNRARLRRQVHGAIPPGVLAYVDDEPVGWCATAPKVDYPRVVASPVSGPETDGVWSVTCFVVRVGWRRRGVAAALLDAAVELARAQGASVIEGYPVDPDARKSVAAHELYHGIFSTFQAAGFEEVSRPYPARPFVRLRIG